MSQESQNEAKRYRFLLILGSGCVRGWINRRIFLMRKAKKHPKKGKMKLKGEPRKANMFTGPSRCPPTTFLSQASLKVIILSAKRGGFQGSAQEAPKRRPRRAQETPGATQERPKAGQATPKRHPRVAQTLQNGVRRAPRRVFSTIVVGSSVRQAPAAILHRSLSCVQHAGCS